MSLKRIGALLAALVLASGIAGCATVREYANCQTAAKVRAAAVDTIEAIDRACPAPVTPAE